MICPKFLKRKVYDDALTQICEYLDINQVIMKLQDVDKLKMVLLDRKQRLIFDNLPKPGIEGRAKSNSFLTMNSMKKIKIEDDYLKRCPSNYTFYSMAIL